MFISQLCPGLALFAIDDGGARVFLGGTTGQGQAGEQEQQRRAKRVGVAVQVAHGVSLKCAEEIGRD